MDFSRNDDYRHDHYRAEEQDERASELAEERDKSERQGEDTKEHGKK